MCTCDHVWELVGDGSRVQLWGQVVEPHLAVSAGCQQARAIWCPAVTGGMQPQAGCSHRRDAVTGQHREPARAEYNVQLTMSQSKSPTYHLQPLRWLKGPNSAEDSASSCRDCPRGGLHAWAGVSATPTCMYMYCGAYSRGRVSSDEADSSGGADVMCDSVRRSS